MLECSRAISTLRFCAARPLPTTLFMAWYHIPGHKKFVGSLRQRPNNAQVYDKNRRE
ncbi:MAG: hypothetical protein LBF72_03795 [Holosporales bacterium]|nr:hypothetical protein [Holosporales bacterium]